MDKKPRGPMPPLPRDDFDVLQWAREKSMAQETVMLAGQPAFISGVTTSIDGANVLTLTLEIRPRKDDLGGLEW